MKKKSAVFRIDWSLLIPSFVLIIISLTSLFSLNTELFRTQLLYVGISIIAFLFFTQVNYKILEFYALPIYIVSLCCLILLLIIGLETRGAVRWIDIFGFRLQFSELIKPFIGIFIASYLSSKQFTFKTFVHIILYLTPILFLIFIQPDLGTAMIYGLTGALTLFMVGFPFFWFIVGFIASLSIIPLMWGFLHDYQKQRLLTFFHPSNDPLGTSYNAIQAMIAVGSGMFLGKGISEGTQSSLRFLPERHTDFIFATITEGLGFIGGALLIITMAFLLYRIYVIYVLSEDSFSKIYAIFAFSLILIQFFVNVGMNIGILPIVGVTLPFVSYGGSSLLSNFIMLGLLSSISYMTRERNVLEIR